MSSKKRTGRVADTDDENALVDKIIALRILERHGMDDTTLIFLKQQVSKQNS